MQPTLTVREGQVMELVALGLTNRKIGERLEISPRTVEIHRGNAIRKLGAENTLDAIRMLEGNAPVPADVVRLVIAARIVWEQGCSVGAQDLTELDRALEAFASRVPYENEPGKEAKSAKLAELEEDYGATINIGGDVFARFIPAPGPVEDGTVRCIQCGQIDEPDYHIAAACKAAVS